MTVALELELGRDVQLRVIWVPLVRHDVRRRRDGMGKSGSRIEVSLVMITSPVRILRMDLRLEVVLVAGVTAFAALVVIGVLGRV